MEQIRSSTSGRNNYVFTSNRRALPHSSDVFFIHAGHVRLEELMQYQTSPTAQRIRKAFEDFQNGRQIVIEIFDKVDDLNQILQSKQYLKRLQLAIKYLCNGLTSFNWLGEDFPICKTISLMEYYLANYQDNPFVDFLYFYLQTSLRKITDKNANLVKARNVTKWLQEIEQKLLSERDNHSNNILRSTYYRLGTEYYASNQLKKSADAFQKCIDLNIEPFNVLFALGYVYRNIKPKKAIGFLKQFLEQAPTCHEQYPHALYTIGVIYFNHFHDHDRALDYYDLAKKAETKRLSFLPRVQCDPKTVLETLVKLDRELLRHEPIAINWKVLSVLIVFVSTVLYVIIKTR